MIDPKNISAVEDDDKVWVNFSLTGYMESCQIYRRMGHYTDVKVHCIHLDSEDVTIYSAHNVLLSAASTYFSFVLVQAFTQISESRMNNLRKVLRVIQDDNTFVDKSISEEENKIIFNVFLYHKIHGDSHYSLKHNSASLTDSCSSFQKEKCFEITLKSFNSANNIIMVVKGLDPLYFKYVLKCIYSESFFIEKKHIQIFLSFIIQIKLINFVALTALLEPFMVSIDHQRKIMNATPNHDPSDSSSINGNSKSAFNLFERREEYTVLNSSYDIYQWWNSNLFQPTSFSHMPLDLSSKTTDNNNNNIQKSIIQDCDKSVSNISEMNTEKGSSFTDTLYNSCFENFHFCQFNDENSNPKKGNDIAFANYLYSLKMKERCNKFLEENSNNKLYNSCTNSDTECKSNNLVPDSNALECLNETEINIGSIERIFKKESKFNNEADESNNNKCNKLHESSNKVFKERDSPLILEKLERNSSIQVKRLDVPINFEKIIKSKLCSKRKSISSIDSKPKYLCKTDIEQPISVNHSINERKLKKDLAPSVPSSSCESSSKLKLQRINSNEEEKTFNVIVHAKNKNLIPKKTEDSKSNISLLSLEKEDFKCFLCKFSSELLNEVISHMKKWHFNQNLRISKCIDLNCPVQLLFTSKEWETHVQHHFIKYIYQCSTCSYSTKTKKGILRHEMTHKSSYKHLNKEKEKNSSRKSIKKNTLKRKCTFSCFSTKNPRKILPKSLVIPEELIEEEISVCTIQSHNLFNTRVFKKFQRSIKKRKNDSSALQKAHFQLTKIVKNHLKLKSKRSSQNSLEASPLKDGEMNKPSNKASNAGPISRSESGNNTLKTWKKSELKEVLATSEKDTHSASSDNFHVHKIKTKTVRLTNKKKLKSVLCSFCKARLESEEVMTRHYYNSHNLILPFKCPHRNCKVYLDNTTTLFTHINKHTGEKEVTRSNVNIDGSSASSSKENEHKANSSGSA